jgi:predicted alpha-1,2-mannosidase
MTGLLVPLVVASGALAAPSTTTVAADPAAYVDPLIGTANGGNTFPGAVLPFGMLQWSPENTRGEPTRRPAPGGYQYDATRIRGFSLTHLSGTGCRGASGDIPFMPHTDVVKTSPSSDKNDSVYTSRFSHVNETAEAGYYQVRLLNGVNVELTATMRTGAGRFTYPAGKPATMLLRTSDSEVGSSDAKVEIDAANRTVSGWVSSGNFCGYLGTVNRRPYYTLHFVAVFDQPFTETGTWTDETLTPGGTTAGGGTTYGTDGIPPTGKGSGGWVGFGTRGGPVNVRVGISYVSQANARANLQAENPPGTTVKEVRPKARAAWNQWLQRIQVTGGTPRELRTFYTALYHSLLHPNVFSDVNGEYWGFDQKPHTVAAPQKAQYTTFSGWDVYRSQVHLVTWLDPKVGSDIAQSLFNQANQNDGVWDRWTHNSGATYVMAGDPSAPAVAGIVAFGGTDFQLKPAFASLVKAATTPTALDLSKEGCPVECRGQRPSLDKWLTIHYIPTVSNSWGGAGETLEDATADFSLAQLALRVGDTAAHKTFLERAGYWRNLFNPAATPDAGYIQNRNEDGTWPRFDPAEDEGFAEGSSAQYTWMIPHDVRGLFEAMGGPAKASRRLDEFFRHPDGSWAITGSGGLHAELDNEPSVGSPWLYLYAGQPARTQDTVRQAVNSLWRDTPHGIPGNDDLGSMSSWYVFAALGFYPNIPGRAELLLGSPLFPQAVVRLGNGKTVTIRAPQAAANVPYVRSLKVDGQPSTKAWLPESFAANGGTLDFELTATPDAKWGTDPADAPPSFPPSGK